MNSGYLSRRLDHLGKLVEGATSRLRRVAALRQKFDGHPLESEFGRTLRGLQQHLGELQEQQSRVHKELLASIAVGARPHSVEDAGASPKASGDA